MFNPPVSTFSRTRILSRGCRRAFVTVDRPTAGAGPIKTWCRNQNTSDVRDNPSLYTAERYRQTGSFDSYIDVPTTFTDSLTNGLLSGRCAITTANVIWRPVHSRWRTLKGLTSSGYTGNWDDAEGRAQSGRPYSKHRARGPLGALVWISFGHALASAYSVRPRQLPTLECNDRASRTWQPRRAPTPTDSQRAYDARTYVQTTHVTRGSLGVLSTRRRFLLIDRIAAAAAPSDNPTEASTARQRIVAAADAETSRSISFVPLDWIRFIRPTVVRSPSPTTKRIRPYIRPYVFDVGSVSRSPWGHFCKSFSTAPGRRVSAPQVPLVNHLMPMDAAGDWRRAVHRRRRADDDSEMTAICHCVTLCVLHCCRKSAASSGVLALRSAVVRHVKWLLCRLENQKQVHSVET